MKNKRTRNVATGKPRKEGNQKHVAVGDGGEKSRLISTGVHVIYNTLCIVYTA